MTMTDEELETRLKTAIADSLRAIEVLGSIHPALRTVEDEKSLHEAHRSWKDATTRLMGTPAERVEIKRKLRRRGVYAIDPEATLSQLKRMEALLGGQEVEKETDRV